MADKVRPTCLSRLDELQRHPVGFADGLHLRVLGIRSGKIGRQAMDVDVLGIVRVGIDLRRAGQPETIAQADLDHVVLGNAVQRLRALHRIRERFGTMIGKAQHTARFQHLVRGLEHRIQRRRTVVQPVVRVAEGQHHVGRIVWSEIHLVRRRKRNHFRDVTVNLRIAFQLLLELARPAVARWRSCFDQMPVRVQERRQDFGVPAAARIEFDHGHVRLDAEESQRFGWMPVFITRLVGVRPPAAGQRFLQQRGGVAGRRDRAVVRRVSGASGAERACKCESNHLQASPLKHSEFSWPGNARLRRLPDSGVHCSDRCRKAIMSRRTINLDDTLYEYLLAHSSREHPEQTTLREATRTHPRAQMQISPEQGQFMALLLKLIGARRCIEIGVFTGYSALSVALALPDHGKILACDISDEYTSIGKPYWQRAGVAHKIDLQLAPALETLDARLNAGEAGTYDFAFIDADKTGYDAYYERCLKLLRAGGLIAIDNVLWGGDVARPAEDEDTRALQALNDKLHRDERIDVAMLPIGDGLTLACKR